MINSIDLPIRCLHVDILLDSNNCLNPCRSRQLSAPFYTQNTSYSCGRSNHHQNVHPTMAQIFLPQSTRLWTSASKRFHSPAPQAKPLRPPTSSSEPGREHLQGKLGGSARPGPKWQAHPLDGKLDSLLPQLSSSMRRALQRHEKDTVHRHRMPVLQRRH